MELNEFIDYLKQEKKTSENTCEAYNRDLAAFERFLYARGIDTLEQASNTDVVAYLMELKTAGNPEQRRIESFLLLELLQVFDKARTDQCKSHRGYQVSEN